MQWLNSLEELVRFIRGLLWPLVWVAEQRPYVALLMVLSVFLVVLNIAVSRRVAYDKRARYRVARWNKQRSSESLGWGFRRIFAVVTLLMLNCVWLFVQVLIFMDLALISRALQGRMGFVLVPFGIVVISTWVLVKFHTLFIARKRADVEMDSRISPAEAIRQPTFAPPPGTPGVLGHKADKYFVGWGTGIMAVTLNVLYIVVLGGVYYWVASLAV